MLVGALVGGVTVENITLHNPRLIRERDLDALADRVRKQRLIVGAQVALGSNQPAVLVPADALVTAMRERFKEENVLASSLGFGSVLVLSHPAIAGPTDVLTTVAAGGVGSVLALLALTVDESDEAFANVYSGAVSLQNLVPRVQQRLLVTATAWSNPLRDPQDRRLPRIAGSR